MRLRAFAVPVTGLTAVLAGLLSFGGLNDNLVYYLTPDEAAAQRDDAPEGRRFRLGGLVEAGSIERVAEGVRFSVTGPGGTSVQVVHSGAPNQLFSEGIGVVVEGAWRGEVFASDTMIVKHDEEYTAPDAGPDGDAP